MIAILIACSGDIAVSSLPGSTHQAIVHGTPEPQNTFLTEAQMLASVYLGYQNGHAFCSGAMVHPRVALTAGHCVDSLLPEHLWVGLGADTTSPDAFLPVSSIYLHPTIDFAFLVLGLDAQSAVPELEPLTMHRMALDDTWIGRQLDAAGYGETFDAQGGRRLFAALELVSYDTETVTVDGHGEQGLCTGDSGGPLLWQPDSATPPALIGIEQHGNASCVDEDHLTRMDVVAPWVDEHLAHGIPPSFELCDSTERGHASCEGTIYVSCDGTYLRYQQCLSRGCGWVGPDEGYGCLPETCQGVDFLGQCDGYLLSYCSDGVLQERNCAEQGLGCIFEDAETGHNCGDCTRCEGNCVDLMNSNDHCGDCTTPCATPNAITECREGQCVTVACIEGFSDSDGDPSNGCEAAPEPTTSDPTEPSPRDDGGCQQTKAWWGIFALWALWRSRRVPAPSGTGSLGE